MKIRFFILFLCFSSITVFSQDLMICKRLKNEKASDYVNRVKPAGCNVIYDILETDEWDKKEKSVIAFYNNPSDEREGKRVFGYLYLRQNDAEYYREISVGEFIGESDTPEILDTMFRNVDSDPEKEFIVLYRYWIIHYDATGYVYDVCIFDNPDIMSDSLETVRKFENVFTGLECVSQEGKSTEAEYKDMKSVRRKLISMGYK
ncbi:MAG: hypothetical protein JW982_02995 [Spirochaetes bacterium]|nr:hypothetical protein [Spirochaetota bacterium]